MRFLLCCICLILFSSVNSQEKYRISFEILELPADASVEISVFEDDSLVSLNDSFSGKYFVIEGVYPSRNSTVILQVNDSTQFSASSTYFLGPGEGHVKVLIDRVNSSIRTIQCSNTMLPAFEGKFNKSYDAIIKARLKEGAELEQLFKSPRTSENRKKIEYNFKEMGHKLMALLSRSPRDYKHYYYFQTQVYSPAPAFLKNDTIYMAEIKQFLNQTYGKNFSQLNSYKSSINFLEQTLSSKRSIGSAAPAIDGKDFFGSDFSIAKLKGKYVVLDFWASWCGPCMQQMPELKKLKNDLKERAIPFELVSINLDVTREAALKAITKLGIDWTVIQDKNSSISKLFKFETIPYLVLIDREGRIAKVDTEIETIRALLLENKSMK